MFTQASRRKRICISFDWHHDRDYRNLLSAWDSNPRINFQYYDVTPGAIRTESVARVKGVITTRIRESTHMLVLVGKYSDSPHIDAPEIGERNWQVWEINSAKEHDKPLIVVSLKPYYSTPIECFGCGARFIEGFSLEGIQRAISDAR